jgi:hypothetical protein
MKIKLHHYGDQQIHLIHFFKDFGFSVAGFLNSKNENILYKTYSVPQDLPLMDPLKFHILYSPSYYDSSNIKKYIIPISPKFHEVLFPELAPAEMKQISFFPELAVSNVPGNTIKKVYLCHAPIKSLEQGSLIFFYRSKDEMCVTTIGVVEKSHRLRNFSELIRIIGKRSVYSAEQINEMIKKEVLLIEFRLIRHLKNPVSYATLLSENILNGPPQSITPITPSYESFKKII